MCVFVCVDFGYEQLWQSGGDRGGAGGRGSKQVEAMRGGKVGTCST